MHKTHANSREAKEIIFRKKNFKGKVKSLELSVYEPIHDGSEKIRKGEFKYSSFYSFNYKGNIFEQEFRNNDVNWKKIYKYDGLENLIEEVSKGSQEEYNWKGIYKYDSKGNCIEEKDYKLDGTYVRKRINMYDERGNRIEEKGNRGDDTLVFHDFYTYNENGDRFEYRDRKNRKVYDYKYKYDKQGNFIEKITSINGMPRDFEERKIEYYE